MAAEQGWTSTRNEDGTEFVITTPTGLDYDLTADDIQNPLIRALVGDMLDGLLSLQAENAALRDRVAMFEGSADADLARMAERSRAVKADNKAIVAGYNAVIAELRAEVARLKGGAEFKGARGGGMKISSELMEELQRLKGGAK